MKAKTFEDFMVWQKAHQLVLGIYRLSKSFPKHELFGLDGGKTKLNHLTFQKVKNIPFRPSQKVLHCPR